LPSQSKLPGLHATSWQVPLAQEEEALARVQAIPHAPQSVAVVRAVSQPFAWVASQLSNPALQDPMAQAEPTHAGAALGKAQTVPQAPQFEVVDRSASQPSFALLLQSSKPGGQTCGFAVCPSPTVPVAAGALSD
jgi:hypothetical protein